MIIWGLGHHGGGVRVARHFVARGDRVIVVDAADAETLAPALDSLAGLPIEFRLGVQNEALEDAFTAANELGVVVNPAIPVSHPMVVSLLRRGVRLTTELELVAAEIADDCEIVVVTGSNGKSGLCHRLGHAERTHLGGNFERDLIGIDEAALCFSTQPGDRVVLEVSSFQAAQLDAFGLTSLQPTTSVLTSLAPNHLDWHGTLENYYAAKRGLLLRTTGRIYGREADLDTLGLHDDSRVQVVENDFVEVFAAGSWPFREGEPRPLRHRREVIAEVDGVTWVDDSAATTPAATQFTLAQCTDVEFISEQFTDARFTDELVSPTPVSSSAFPNRGVVLILGGRNKDLPSSELDALARFVAPRTIAVATIGETAGELARLIAIHGGKVRSCRTLPKAVKWSRKLLASAPHRGGVLLLSPGMSSVDQFADYRARGHAFGVLSET